LLVLFDRRRSAPLPSARRLRANRAGNRRVRRAAVDRARLALVPCHCCTRSRPARSPSSVSCPGTCERGIAMPALLGLLTIVIGFVVGVVLIANEHVFIGIILGL